MLDTHNIFEICKDHGFTDEQSKGILLAFENAQYSLLFHKNELGESSFANRIKKPKEDIIEIKYSLKMIERILYSLYALGVIGFGLMAYLIKG